jgi:hypothetical protein
MPRFVIDLGDIEMSAEAQSSLNSDLQKVALTHLSGLRYDRPFAIRFPHEWLGLILRADFDRILNVEKDLGQVLSVPVGRSR